MRNFSQKLFSGFAGKIGIPSLMVLCFALLSLNINAQSPTPTTIVNYDFNAAVASAPCSATPTTTATNVTSTITTSNTGSACDTTNSGVATTATAFTQNTTAGRAITITEFATGATEFIQFQLGGSGLTAYTDYQVYFQANRSNTGASSATLQYSTDGTNFTTFGSPITIGTNFTAFNFDLSSITDLDNQANVFFRIVGTGGSNNNGVLRVDNFQVQAVAVGPTAAGVSLSGRVANESGQGIGRARILLFGGSLTEPVYAFTDSDGNYSFSDIPAGETYTLSVSVKGYKFDQAIIVVNVNEDITDAHFTGKSSRQRIRIPIE